MKPFQNTFLYNASLLGAGTLLANDVFAIFKGLVAPSDQVNIGAIGINGMGWSNLNALLKIPGVNLVALCDIDKNVIEKRMGELAKLNVDTSKVKTFNDHRRLLEMKELDAVIIARPHNPRTNEK